jgi:uncharacterized protein (TIGR02246 family)
MSPEDAVRDLYRRVIAAWNASDARAMAAPIAPGALMIGLDGSQLQGRDEIEAELGRIFADHETASYVTKVRAASKPGGDAALLWAVAGMPSPESSEIMPDRNAAQTLVARRDSKGWSVALFQTTPAQLHGRDDLREALMEELSEALRQQS